MYTQVSDKLYCLTLPFGKEGVNSYLFQGERGFTVLDTGFRDEATQWVWRNAIKDGLVIEKVVLSHGHPDHMGLASWFQKEIGVPVVQSRIGFERMRKYRVKALQIQRDEDRLYPFHLKHDGPPISEKQFYDQMAAFDFDPDDVFDDHEQVRLGDRFFEAVWTPGHAPDHFCFWEPDQSVLLVGDHVLEGTSPVISYWSEDDGNPLRDYFQSLERLENYAANLVLPGHGKPISNLKKRMAELREGHFARLKQIVELLDERGKTAGQVRRELYGEEKVGVLNAMEFSSTLSRLAYLEAEGRIRSQWRGGKAYFSVQGAAARRN